MSKLLIGTNAPNVTFTDFENRQIALSSFQGEPVLLNFFKSNCVWCRSELVNLAYVYRRVENVQVKIIGILVGQDAATARQFAEEQNLDIPILLDNTGESQAAFQLERVPTLVLLDASGKITCVFEGATEQLAGIVEQTILAIAGGQELPEYSLVGNGCGVND